MRIDIDLRKGLQENAASFFEGSKLAKRKLLGVQRAIQETRARVGRLEAEKALAEEKIPEKKRAKKWFEKFHWFYSSDGFLVLAGRDAQSNESLMKKHAEPSDVYFHAEVHGAPHVLVKASGREVPSQTLHEAAVFAATYSSAWRDKLSHVDVYSAKPEQVSKKAPSGEALGTGAFMVYGARQWFRRTPLELSIGISEENSSHAVVAGPHSAVEKNSVAHIKVFQGNGEKGEVAKKILAAFWKAHGKRIPMPLDEIIAALPAGGCALGD